MCHNTGYRGRVGVYELLQVTDTIRELIVGRATHHELRAAAIAEGMRTMQEQAFELVVDGVTTVEDVLRSVYAPGCRRRGATQKELPAGKRALARGCAAGLPGGRPCRGSADPIGRTGGRRRSVAVPGDRGGHRLMSISD